MIALILVLGLVGALLIVVFAPRIGITRQSARMLKDSTQVRGIVQGIVNWAGANQDEYPIPSRIDRANDTVAGPAESKDTTANIMSLLVFNGLVPVEMLVSPAEANPRITVFEGYNFSDPSTAVNPSKALWDPALSADFTSEKGGSISYAHKLPHEFKWGTQSAALLGNRGPEIASITKGPDGSVAPAFANPQSYTFRIHGSRTKWEGMIGYNDNHVEFVLDPIAGGRYKSTDGKEWPDALFYDEPDDADATNAFLGIFIKAGQERKDFIAIWD